MPIFNKHKKKLQSHTLSSQSAGNKRLIKGYKFRWWHAAALILIIVITGIAILRFSRAGTGEPSQYQIYSYIKDNRAKYGATVLDEGGSNESLLLPVDRSKLGINQSQQGAYQGYVLYINPSKNLPRFWEGRRCVILNTPETTASVQRLIEWADLNKSFLDVLSFINIGSSIKEASKNALEIGVGIITDSQGEDEQERERTTMLMGSAFNCDGTPADRFGLGGQGNIASSNGVPAYSEARAIVKNIINTPTNEERARAGEEPYATCYRAYTNSVDRDACVNDPNGQARVCANTSSNAPACLHPPPRTPVSTPPVINPTTTQTWDDSTNSLDKQNIQIALYNGVSTVFLKVACDKYTPPGNATCKAYVDQQVPFFQPGGLYKPQPVIVYDVPYCISIFFNHSNCNQFNPLNGGNDGKWKQLPEDRNWYFHDGIYVGGGRLTINPNGAKLACLVPNGRGGFDVPSTLSCDEVKQRAFAQFCNSLLDPSRPETFINIDPSCDPTGKLRAAGSYAAQVKLNQTVPKGNLEGLNGDCTILSGWATSDANPNRAIDIDLYFDAFAGGNPSYSVRVKADKQRDDLRQFGNNGYHGMRFDMPNSLKDGKPHMVFAYAIGIRTDGSLNGKNPLVGGYSFTCDQPPKGNLEKIDARMDNGTFRCTARGWAADDSALNNSIKIDAYVDGVGVLNRGSADQYRVDLQNAGLGNGKHQYVFDLPAQFRDAKKHRLEVYGIGVNRFGQQNGVNQLVGTMEFQCDQPPLGSADKVVTNNDPSNPTCVIHGWTSDPSFYFDNYVVAYYDLSNDSKTFAFKTQPQKASLPRPDLITNKVPVYGNALHGFQLPVDRRFFDGKVHTVFLYGLNVDEKGTYIAQNNTFIGKQFILCPRVTDPAVVVNKSANLQTSNILVSSGTVAVKNPSGQQVSLVVVGTPLSYDQESGSKLATQASSGRQIPATIPSDINFANTQAAGDNGPTLNGFTLIKPDFPVDLNINKVVIYIDGKAPKVYGSMNDAIRQLDTRTLPDGTHTVQVLAYSGNTNVRAVQQRIQTNNGGLSTLQRFYYSTLSAGNR